MMDMDGAMSNIQRNKYRFVGLVTELGDIKLDRVGQVLTLSQGEFDILVKDVPLIDEESFKSIFDEEELARYGHANQRSTAPRSLTDRLHKAIEVVSKFRNR